MENSNQTVLTGEWVDFDIKVAWLSIAKMYNPLAHMHGISLSMGLVLLIIDEERGAGATKIAPLLGMEPRSLTRILKTMEEMALIRRKRDQKDKRSVRIYLTEKGIEKKQFATHYVALFNKLVEQNIDSEKLRTFFEVTRQINDLALSNKIQNITLIK